MNEAIEPKLMQLSIPRLWCIGDNKFYDVDPVCEPGSDFIENAFEGFIEDVLWLFEWRFESDLEGNTQIIIPKTTCYCIDLSWRPDSRIQGEYIAKLDWYGKNDYLEVEKFFSKDRYAIRDKIEAWMDDVTFNYIDSHNRYP